MLSHINFDMNQLSLSEEYDYELNSSKLFDIENQRKYVVCLTLGYGLICVYEQLIVQ